MAASSPVGIAMACTRPAAACSVSIFSTFSVRRMAAGYTPGRGPHGEGTVFGTGSRATKRKRPVLPPLVPYPPQYASPANGATPRLRFGTRQPDSSFMLRGKWPRPLMNVLDEPFVFFSTGVFEAWPPARTECGRAMPTREVLPFSLAAVLPSPRVRRAIRTETARNLAIASAQASPARPPELGRMPPCLPNPRETTIPGVHSGCRECGFREQWTWSGT